MIRNLPPVTKNLLIINILIWLVQEFVPSIGMSMDRYCALYYVESPLFYPWQLFTYMFMHGGFTHLFFNMFALLMFGGLIERTMGSGRFLFFYISCGVGAALIQEGVFAIMANHLYGIIDNAEYITADIALRYQSMMLTPTVGASGAIYGILLAFGMLYPNMPLYIMFIPVPMKAKWVVLGYGVLELTMGIGNIDSSVAHFAHLGGMLFAFLMIFYWKKKGVFHGWH